MSATLSVEDAYGALLEKRPEALADPYAIFTRMRAEAPVLRHGPVVALTRHEDIMWVFRNEERFHINAAGEGRRFDAIMAALPAEQATALREVTEFERLYVSRTDGDVHARLRRIAHRAFTPRRIAEMDASIQAYADELLADIDPAEPFDFIDRFAFRLPLLVIGDMLSIPTADLESIHQWSSRIGSNRGGTDAALILDARDALAAFRGYVAELVADHRANPSRHDLVDTLLDANEAEHLTEEELAAMFVILLFAGHETTTNLLGNGLIALLQNRDQWDRLCADPAMLPSAVEELLRFDSPIQQVTRVVVEETEIGGVPLELDDTLLLTLGSANRDAAAFDDPDRLDIGRDPNRHLSLAFGPHFCLGASLARMEGRIAFAALTQRFPGAELAADEFEHSSNLVLRGVRSLPLLLGG
jgi:pimeloyl-[acyl-carrier protein] synthase